jgi:exosortase/archaeosortase family protein
MDKNLKNFIIKLVVFATLLFAIRAMFQTPVEYFRLKMFYESNLTRVFSKGDAMKVIAFAGICFFLAFRKKIEKIQHEKANWKISSFFFILSLLPVAGYYYLRYVENLYHITGGIQLYGLLAAKFTALALSGLFLILAVFQINYTKNIIKHLGKEILITGILMVIFYFLLMFFQEQWRFFSDTVGEILIALLSPFYNVIANRGTAEGTILTVNTFTISIGAPCSGIESMLLFTALFGVIFALDHKDLKKGQYALAFALGLIGDFFVNNLRLLILILIGIHISPKLAVGLFHTHAGWIFFLLYFMTFYWLVKKFIYKKSFTEKK